MEYNLGEDHGEQWCSEECRWWSDILVRNMTDDLVIASDEKWLLFYRARYGHDIPLENIPNPRDFYPVLTDRKYVGKTAHRRVTSLPAHLYGNTKEIIIAIRVGKRSHPSPFKKAGNRARWGVRHAPLSSSGAMRWVA